MQLMTLFLLASSVFAESPEKPDPRDAKIAELTRQLQETQATLELYQRGMFTCQDAQIRDQAKKQVDAQQRQSPKKEK